ncbi:MAG: S1-like domain-containing RNA-binding protein [Arcobacter sp.]|jgi:predicted RNA-binding protein (virulence factor B family)|uniref:CvfB family protein n=1 Tax=Arcobacter sp. TaxID=1872629 RepID=UPI002A75349D|nr:S1-like domain-containing RNA-binding protein [Arcobacter sp.]MDY3204300.1 S1-like domain-containing RNA-binding protein [Arcobacter sp.]
MNEKIEVGRLNTLRVNRVSEPGIYLISEDETEVLLPNAYVNKSMEIDSLLDVFIYTDSEDRLVATTLKPYVYLYEFAFLEVVDNMKFGSFVDIGLPKHILVPKNKQKGTYEVGKRKVLQLQLDDRTNRLIASEKYDLLKSVKNLEKNDEVEIILYSKTPLGYKVIVNDRYEGMIYHTEIFENLKIGDKKRAYIKNIRPDNKIDLSLQKIGIKVSGDKVFDVLVQNGGKLDFTYKSEASDINEVFGLSKKAFKASLTKLISEDKIVLEESGIRVK